MIDFDSFSNRWEITAKLTLVTPMHIGGGQNAGAYSLSQTPVMLSYDSQTELALPYIPGSSLKGILRSTVERIVRTFNEEKGCIAVANKNDKTTKILCGNCISCFIFGSQKTGASIRVQDSHLSKSMYNRGTLEERTHCSTVYSNKNGFYVKIKNKSHIPKTNLRQEEIVAANTSFDITINLDNADEKDVGIIILALNEFNHKRCYLGGGISRGYGFADVNGLRVTKKALSDNPENLFKIEPEQLDPYIFCELAREYLKNINDEKEVYRTDFDVYYKAYEENGSEGYIVKKYEIETLTKFQMPGVDEVTVTSQGVPIIPGSTLKGFLRHKLIDDAVHADTINNIFGSIKDKNQHRSHLIISDAYPKSDFTGNDYIPEGTKLTLWIIFDNMTTDEIELIDNALSKEQVITGNKVANNSPKSHSVKNKVNFINIDKSKFDANKFLKE